MSDDAYYIPYGLVLFTLSDLDTGEDPEICVPNLKDMRINTRLWYKSHLISKS